MTVRDFFFTLSQKVNPSAIEGQNTVLHFDIAGAQGGQYSVLVHDSKVEVLETLTEGEPRCKVTAKDEDFLALLNGSANPMMAVLSGKIKATNLGELMKYAKILGLI